VDTELPLPVGYLGLIPVGLGLWGIWRHHAAPNADGQIPEVRASILALTVLFLSLSFDTFAVFTPLLADSQAAFTAPVLGGALISTIAIAAVGAASAGIAPSRKARVAKLERFAPYVMIAVGLYVLLNTATDALL
jgi:cadmium resistance protein CadD (predicted permease)